MSGKKELTRAATAAAISSSSPPPAAKLLEKDNDAPPPSLRATAKSGKLGRRSIRIGANNSRAKLESVPSFASFVSPSTSSSPSSSGTTSPSNSTSPSVLPRSASTSAPSPNSSPNSQRSVTPTSPTTPPVEIKTRAITSPSPSSPPLASSPSLPPAELLAEFPPPPPPPSFDVSDEQIEEALRIEKQEEARVKVIDELWETEGGYVADLEVLYYLIPLRDTLKRRESIMPPAEIPKIFCNIEQLLSVNSEILARLDIHLEKGLLGGSVENDRLDTLLTAIAKIFVDNKEHMKCYTSYCLNIPAALEALAHVAKSPAYQEFEELTRQSTNRLRLDSFISKPMQRICKYPLFFNQLIKETPANQSSYAHLKAALEAVEEVARHINTAKNQKENKEKLQEISGIVHGYKKPIILPERVFIREGDMLKFSPSNKKQERHFYLFNDMFMYCKKNGSSHIFKDAIAPHLILARASASPNSLELLRTDTRRVYPLVCKNEFEAKEWLKDLTRISDESAHRQERSVQKAREMIRDEWK